MTVIGSTNKNVFETYVEQILVPQLWPGAIVLMDNLSVHKGQRIEDLINSAGAELIFLPAYSPERVTYWDLHKLTGQIRLYAL